MDDRSAIRDADGFDGLNPREAQDRLESALSLSTATHRASARDDEEPLAPAPAGETLSEDAQDIEAAGDRDSDEVPIDETLIDETLIDEGDTVDIPSVEDVSDAVWTAAQMADHLRMLEALLFASPEPLDPVGIKRRLPEGADIPALIEALEQLYENRGVILSKAGGRYRFVTSPDVAHVLEIEKTETRKLSRAALETLAIIAYHQPCTRADIEDVRGVAVSRGSLDQLMEIGWVRLRGRRRDAPGRPVLYGTTPAFLEHFNLETVGDLPGMADLKAAGLLDARLPPGFDVPSPSDARDDEIDDGEAGDEGAGDAGGAAEFVQDFHDDRDASDADISDDDEH